MEIISTHEDDPKKRPIQVAGHHLVQARLESRLRAVSWRLLKGWGVYTEDACKIYWMS